MRSRKEGVRSSTLFSPQDRRILSSSCSTPNREHPLAEDGRRVRNDSRVSARKKKKKLSKMKRDAKRTRIAGKIKHSKKKKVLSNPALKAGKRVTKMIRKNIEELAAAKVATTGKRFVLGDLNDKAKTKMKSNLMKRNRKEMKAKRRFETLEDKIQEQLAQLRRED